MLHVLNKCKACLRKVIIKKANPELIKTICEICLNILNGNIKISKKCKDSLKKYKKNLRKLATSKGNLASKKKIIIQKGGFLPIILGSLLSSAFAKLLENINS